jgi:hypothetical protein
MSTEPITPGTKIGNWIIASINGRAATCQCTCGSLRVLSVASLIDGSCAPSCSCAPLTSSCSEFEARGGKVSRDVGQSVQIRCGCCSVAWMVAASWAIRHPNRQTCIRCGSGNVTTHW